MAAPQDSQARVNLIESPPDKVVLVGDVGVGKTSLFMRFKTDEFVRSVTHNPKEGEFHKEWNVNGSQVSMTMFDTAGLERHMSTIPQTYFRWSKVVMLVYCIDDSDTFDSLTNWSENALSAGSRAQSDVISVLVGNKLDLADSDRKVTAQRAHQYADNNDIAIDMIFEVSAKDGTGVQNMFDSIALKIKPPKPSTRSGKGESDGKPCC